MKWWKNYKRQQVEGMDVFPAKNVHTEQKRKNKLGEKISYACKQTYEPYEWNFICWRFYFYDAIK